MRLFQAHVIPCIINAPQASSGLGGERCLTNPRLKQARHTWRSAVQCRYKGNRESTQFVGCKSELRPGLIGGIRGLCSKATASLHL